MSSDLQKKEEGLFKNCPFSWFEIIILLLLSIGTIIYMIVTPPVWNYSCNGEEFTLQGNETTICGSEIEWIDGNPKFKEEIKENELFRESRITE